MRLHTLGVIATLALACPATLPARPAPPQRPAPLPKDAQTRAITRVPAPKEAGARVAEPKEASAAGAGAISYALYAPLRRAGMTLDLAAARLLDSLAFEAAAEHATQSGFAQMKQVADSLGRAIVAVAESTRTRSVSLATLAAARRRCATGPLCAVR